MGEDNSKVNIVQLFQSGSTTVADRPTSPTGAKPGETGPFIADMLEALIGMAAKENSAALVYLLAIARIEALEVGRKCH